MRTPLLSTLPSNYGGNKARCKLRQVRGHNEICLNASWGFIHCFVGKFKAVKDFAQIVYQPVFC